MKNKLFLILTFLFLGSCTLPNINRDNLVRTSSSAAGGYLGYHLSDGDFFSTSVGSTVGLILGETLAEFIGQDDNYYFSQETLRILEINDNNNSTVTGYWKNPKSRNEGVIRIKGFYGNSDCRLIEHIYVNDSSGPKNNFRTACREESGKWAMIK
jgi:surface antigen